MYDADTIAKAIKSVMENVNTEGEIKVGVSQRHVHLSQEDLETLFGKGYELTVKKYLMGREFASNEVVTLVGPSLKSIENVRVLGPVRKNTQVEISRTDTFVLKVSPPVRPSGNIEGSEKVVLVGPRGSVYLKEGVIIANRHIHLTPEYAMANKIKDNDYVDVEVDENKKNKTEDTSAETTDTTPTEKTTDNKGNNLFKQLYIEQGYDGIVKMLLAVKESLGSFFSKLYKTFTINEFYLTMHVTGSDAADTAIKYGKLSSWLFPVLGKVASTCKMKKYDIDISPDFLGVKNEADLYLDVSVVPIRITNALVVLAIQLLFKVILKILFANMGKFNQAQTSIYPKEQ